MEKLLVLTLVAGALVGKSLAVDRIVVNADNIIKKLYIDGIDRTNELVGPQKWQKCDKIDIPYNSGVIAIEAVNLKSFYGIQECETAGNAIYDPWRCRRVRPAQGCWWLPSYRARWWKLAKGFPCKKHCRKYYKQPCKLYNTKCYWTNKYAKRVRCRKMICADNCLGCKNTGPGKCDPDKCKYGAGPTGECRRECAVDFDLCSKDANLPIWDTTSKTPMILDMKLAGLYAVALNMSTCSITKSKYWELISIDQSVSPWTAITDASNWGQVDSMYTNLVGFKFNVGPGPLSMAPLFQKFNALGIGTATIDLPNKQTCFACIYRATFRAAPGEKVITTSEEAFGKTPGKPCDI